MATPRPTKWKTSASQSVRIVRAVRARRTRDTRVHVVCFPARYARCQCLPLVFRVTTPVIMQLHTNQMISFTSTSSVGACLPAWSAISPSHSDTRAHAVPLSAAERNERKRFAEQRKSRASIDYNGTKLAPDLGTGIRRNKDLTAHKNNKKLMGACSEKDKSMSGSAQQVITSHTRNRSGLTKEESNNRVHRTERREAIRSSPACTQTGIHGACCKSQYVHVRRLVIRTIHVRVPRYTLANGACVRTAGLEYTRPRRGEHATE